MILIGEAGGNKTDWRLVDGQEVVKYLGNGFNLKTHPLEPFFANLPEPLLGLSGIRKVYFYAAGVTPDADVTDIRNRFINLYRGADCFVHSDTLAAARGLFGTTKGYVCILGTGSGAAYYNGREITKRIPSLGYILGDEGSGVAIGRSLLTTYLRSQFPSDLSEKFKAEFNTTEKDVLKKVYNQPGANTYLSGFVRFAVEHQAHPFVHSIIKKQFEEYFEAYFPKPLDDAELRFTGSVAFLFRDILEQVASARSVKIATTVKSPIEGLIKFHQEHD